ncbi:type I DNA topoisomerase [Pumilibacter muris]|uniref:type I DNA topoisomerase n=1 Tax=Pumilibacter muris TaxID=2941510 RepID=UPI0020418A50|nr:type I DNA topoisomerase [Pumilibacter muris]
MVIEGIGKKETVEKYLGPGYRVFATKGHVRDLPAKTLAVNVKKDFEPKYVIMDDKKDVVEQLKAAVSKADEVLLATDPDREGEAISWHVANILGIPEDSPVRIEFNEISKKAVQNALKNPRAIDINLVDAQQARRVLDRLVGYKLSPVLCKKIQNKLSAGRVQSVTLRLVVEREREILNFKPEEYWPFFSVLKNQSGSKIKAALATRNKQKFKIPNEQTLKEVISELDGKEYEVVNVKKSVTKSKPPAPFITSSMQQDALNKLGMSLKQTSSAAQSLYEGVDLPGEGKVALITYIRTDSTRVSDDAIKEARSYISEKFGEKFIPAKPNIYASKKSAQDAHEAIRPISLSRTPESIKNAVNKYHYKLYKLIYERFMASQMSEATYNSLSVDITAGNYGFKVTGKSPLFAGYTAVYNMYTDESKEDEEESGKLPDLHEGEKLGFCEYKYEQKFTKPPARFTEASLVKTMEEKGIGRPATYTPTVTLLNARSYTEHEGKYIRPTQLGMDVTDMLIKYFPDIMDVKFTAGMEKRLDEIEEGGVIWQRVVGDFYNGFEEKISEALGDTFSLKAPDEKTDFPCPTCGTLMVVKNGRFGKFLACPNYPKCRTTLPYDEETGKPATQTETTNEESNVKCEKCGRTMVLKQGKYGPFLACPGYPECKNIVNIDKNGEAQEKVESAPCPQCGKPLKQINSRGSVFYGCTGYPECRFTANAPLAEGKCPDCGSHLLIRKYKDGVYHVCASKTCKYKTKAD